MGEGASNLFTIWYLPAIIIELFFWYYYKHNFSYLHFILVIFLF